MTLYRPRMLTFGLLLLTMGYAPRAEALERICDVAFENCRIPLVDLIRKETVGIDVAFWFMEDQGLATELINRFKAGVPVRVLVETQANTPYPDNATTLRMLKDAKIPMRNRSSGIMHWKFMIFAGQNTVQFSGANYSREAFMYSSRYSNYVDEVIYFTHKPTIVASFMTKMDDAWVASSGWSNYANVPATRLRTYPPMPLDPELNFPPGQNFRTRSAALYSAEPTRIDSIMYRITDRAHADAIIATVKRGIPVRLYTEQKQYRDAARLWHAYNVDRLYMAGVQIRDRQHAGLNHEKLTILVGQGTVVFGSSNWTPEAANGQQEHNLFTTDPAWYAFATSHFERKWNNLASSPETKPFVPLPPDAPSLRAPANAAQSQGTTVTLRWWAGPWAHKYDVYLGTSPTAMTKVLSNRALGPSESSTDTQSHTVSGLAANTTYYWKVVSKTMANLSATSPTWNFSTGTSPTTSEPPPPPPSTLPSGWSNQDIGRVSAAGNVTFADSLFTVKGSGADVWGSVDELHFAYTPISGDGSITARVDSVTYTNAWTKVGVMLRETTAANSKHAFMLVSPGKGLALQFRASTGGATSHIGGPRATAPYWVRLTRAGTRITAAISTDGLAWTTVGSATISMGSSIHAGLVVSSHVDGTLATARFSNVRVVP